MNIYTLLSKNTRKNWIHIYIHIKRIWLINEQNDYNIFIGKVYKICPVIDINKPSVKDRLFFFPKEKPIEPVKWYKIIETYENICKVLLKNKKIRFS